MSLPSSDQTPESNRKLDAAESSGMSHDSPTIITHSLAAESQLSVQTLDPDSFAANLSNPSVSATDQSEVRTLDSRNFDSSRPAPSTDAVGQTFAEAPTDHGSVKSGVPSQFPASQSAGAGTSATLRSSDRYVLLENFAHGGLGNIWRAEDTAIRREVAFKELLPKALRNPIQVERFVEEAQISGQLEHPGIIPIYDVGFRENGTPYYTMKLVRGTNMEEAIETMHKLPQGGSERQLAFNRLLRQFIAICQAVGFAHEKGVLHRDLKPQNVMLGEFGETLLLDWGLAKLVDLIGEQMISSDRSARSAPTDEQVAGDEQTDVATVVMANSQYPGATMDSADVPPPSHSELEVTQGHTARSVASTGMGAAKTVTKMVGSRTFNAASATSTGQRPVQTGMRSVGSQTLMGQVMGTPAYMSPEQALGQIDELDDRSDIYSLGGVLYRLLTNKQPVGRGKVQEVLDKVIQGLIPPPRTIDAAIPKPLEAICLKAMSKEKSARYLKALDLAADVEAWLADQPVSAYPDPWPERFRHWRKQHRTLVVSSSATLIVLIGSVVVAQCLDANHLNRLRNQVRAKIADARVAKNKSEFGKADDLLQEAKGFVVSEPRLVAERDDIGDEFDDVVRRRDEAENDRLSKIRSRVEFDFVEVQHAIDDIENLQQAFQQAKFILNGVEGRLRSEPALAELHQQVQTQLEVVNQFERFNEEVEQTRVFGGNISGDESLDDLRESKRHALEAMKIFAVDADRPDQAGSQLQSLGKKAIAKWREGMQEVLVTLAYLETKLAIRDDPDDLQKAARLSLDHLQQAERLGFSSQPMWYLRADLFGLLNQPDDAQTARHTAEMLKPSTRLDHYLLGEFKRGQGNYKEALAHFEDALQADPNDFWSLNMLGLCHFQMGQYEAVIPSCTGCIARRPQFDWPYLARGVAFGKLKDFTKAHQDIAKALDLKPQSYHAYLNRGVIYAYQKNYEAARADFEQASQLKPDQAAPHINLAAIGVEVANELLNDSQKANAALLAEAEFQKANVALTAAIKHSPQQASIYSFRGKIRLAQKSVEAALADFEKANKLDVTPLRRSENHQQIGDIHFRAGRLPLALAAYDQSLEENPDNVASLRQRAETFLALRRFEEAERDFTAVLKKAGSITNVADVYRGRSIALTALKKPREAINDYTMSLQYEPAPNMLARRGWAYLLEAAQLAKEDFEEAVRLNPEDPDFYQGLAFAMVTLGDHANAVAQLEKNSENTKRVVATLGPKSWQYLFNPATVYAQAHDKALTDVKLAPDRRDELAREYSQKAVELLLQARQLAGPQFLSGFLRALRADPALDPIRQRPEYHDALKTLDPESAVKLESKESKPSQKP